MLAAAVGEVVTFKYRMVSEVLSGKDAAADVRAALKREVEGMEVRRVALIFSEKVDSCSLAMYKNILV